MRHYAAVKDKEAVIKVLMWKVLKMALKRKAVYRREPNFPKAKNTAQW